MGHLRSFLEGLQREILPAAHAKFGGTMPKKWGDGLLYLRTNGVLAQSEEAGKAGAETVAPSHAPAGAAGRCWSGTATSGWPRSAPRWNHSRPQARALKVGLGPQGSPQSQASVAGHEVWKLLILVVSRAGLVYDLG